MRHPRSLSPSWLIVTILLTYLTYTTSQSQSHLVCRRPDSQNCLVWLIVENKGNKKTATSLKTIRTYCGLSNLRPVVHLHRRYVQIQELDNIPSTKRIFCKIITKMGEINNWQEITNALETAKRVRRQAYAPRGRYRGQTQSQYLAIDRGNGKDEGKAEAHSAADSSRAVVSGNSGMGQAQSQSIYDPNCDDCGDRINHEIENLKRPTSLKPGDSVWPGQNGLNQSPNRGFNQNGPDHYGASSYIPTLGSTRPMSKGNENDIFVPQNMGARQPGSSGDGDRPISNTHGGYDPNNFPGTNDYRPIASQTGIDRDNYGPSDTRDNRKLGSNGYPAGFIPGADRNDKRYSPNSNMGPEGYHNPNTRLGSISDGKPGPSKLGGSDLGLYGPQGGSNNYLPGYGTNKYNAQIPGNMPSGPGSDLNQGGVGPFGNGMPRDLINTGKPTSHINFGYAPGSQISNPNVGTRPYGSVNELGKPNPSNLNQRELYPQSGVPHPQSGVPYSQSGVPSPQSGVPYSQSGVPHPQSGVPYSQSGVPHPQSGVPYSQSGVPQFSTALGPYPGPGGSSVYCCVVPNPAQNGNVYPNYKPGDANNLGPGATASRPSGQYGGNHYIPDNYGNYGQYSPTNTGLQYEPKSNFGTTVPQGSLSSPGGQYGSDVHPYGPTTGGGSYPPGSQFDSRGTLHSPDRPYNSNAPSGSEAPNGQYTPLGTGSSSGSPMPGGQYGQGNAGTPIGTGFQYGTNIPGSNGLSAGPYGPNNVRGTSNNGVNSPADTGFPYGQSISGSGASPGGQYGVNVPTGTAPEFSPSSTTSGKYGPGAIGPGGQYDLNGHNGGVRPNGVETQHGPGISGVLPGNGNVYRPSENKGLGGNIGDYGTGNLGGRPAGHYGSSSPIDSLESRGHYEPGGVGGPIGNIGQYNPGGSVLPGGQYRPNSVGVPTGNGGEYGPSGPISTSGPSGENRPGGSVGQYDPGNSGGSLRPGGQHGQSIPFGTVGQNVLDGFKSPGGEGKFGPSGPSGPNNQYGQVSPGNLGGVYGPGEAVKPFENTRQYGPSSSYGGALPGGQYRPSGPGGAIGNVGQYIPGTSGDSARPSRPDQQYGLNSPGSSAGPGGINGQFVPSGVRTNQYGPGDSDGSAGPGGPFGLNIGNQQGGGQLGPGAAKEGFMPGGKFTPSKDGLPYGYNNNGGPGGQSVGDYNGVPQNYVDPNSINADGDDSAAEASVAQNINGTTASASSKGGNDKGRAQTNVQGTYTGGGSFQAQAQITGENKEALSEVSGGKKGASSSASGSGRNNKSQANVQLGSETGSVQTQSQSNGVMHSSNSQVQGSVKGGMADAQARGPGSTSSQAQIGFTPYKDAEKTTHDLQKIPFMGGGMASAQSSGRTGQSQSQLHGTFKYGITYNGAAQSGASLDKDAVFPNRLSFEKINVFDEKEKNIDVDKISMDVTEVPDNKNTEASSVTDMPSPPAISQSSAPDISNNKESGQSTATENNLYESMKNSESRYTGHTHLDHHQSEPSNKTASNSPTLSSNRRSFQTNFPTIPEYEFTTDRDDTQPEYDTDVGYDGDGNGNEANDVEQTEYSNYDEYTKDPPTHQYIQSPNRKGIDLQQTTGGNTQHIVLGSLKNHNAEIIQKDSGKPDESKVYQPGERVPGTGGYTIPIGFTGSVKSVASKDNTYVIGSKESPSQAQTVTLTPGTGKVRYTQPSSYGRYVKAKNLRSLQSPKEDDNKYVSVSKSVTRALDSDNNIRKQYSHTYYTKSSSCGYFTFTCTMVSSAEGRKKVCKPKMPTNPDGTPIRC